MQSYGQLPKCPPHSLPTAQPHNRPTKFSLHSHGHSRARFRRFLLRHVCGDLSCPKYPKNIRPHLLSLYKRGPCSGLRSWIYDKSVFQYVLGEILKAWVSSRSIAHKSYDRLRDQNIRFCMAWYMVHTVPSESLQCKWCVIIKVMKY